MIVIGLSVAVIAAVVLFVVSMGPCDPKSYRTNHGRKLVPPRNPNGGRRGF